MRLSLRAAWLTLGLALLAGPPLRGQAIEHSRLLREAAARESQGDYDGAERVLRRLLAASPTSSGGLFALERVLRAKGDPRAVLPAVDTFLAHDPGVSGVRHLKLRVLAELDSLGALEEEAERWFRLQPGAESPYREVSRLYERTFGAPRALEVLRRGRAALGEPQAFALEIGDLLAAGGDHRDAVREWRGALDGSPGQASVVARRVAGLPAAGRDAGQGMVASLAEEPDPAIRRSGVQIALALGLESEVLALARRVAAELEGDARGTFLAEVARGSREAGLGSVGSWAYGELGQEAGSPAERRRFDQRVVETALAAGDTAAALAAQRRLAESFTPGSADRRRATAHWIRLEAASAKPERLRGLLADFRAAFPDAPELDELAAAAAEGLVARGDARGAEEALRGASGPRSALQRGYLLLAAGELDQARSALLVAARDLDPSEATEVIQLAGLLGRLSPEGARLLAAAGAVARRGGGAEAAELVADSLAGLPGEEAPALLAEAARMAERGGADGVAAQVRARLLSAHPDAPEAAEGALLLAGHLARSPDGRAEAIRLLEDLLTRRPDAAVAPDARRALERLRRAS